MLSRWLTNIYRIDRLLSILNLMIQHSLTDNFMDRWAPLFSKIVDSSIWDEDDMVCKVWVTLLALKDSDHVVRKTLYQIGRAARKSEEDVLKALKVLASPDTKRKEEQEYEGRRVKKLEDGWLILNGNLYEKLMRQISRQVYQAKWVREKRAKMKGTGSRTETGVADLNSQVENGRIPHEPESGTVPDF